MTGCFMGNQIPYDTRQRIVLLLKAGETQARTAKLTGASRTTVGRIALKVLGKQRPRISKKKRDEIARLVQGGMSRREAARRLGVSRGSAQTIAKGEKPAESGPPKTRASLEDWIYIAPLRKRWGRPLPQTPRYEYLQQRNGDPNQIIRRLEVDQWRFLITTMESLARLASVLVDPTTVETGLENLLCAVQNRWPEPKENDRKMMLKAAVEMLEEVQKMQQKIEQLNENPFEVSAEDGFGVG